MPLFGILINRFPKRGIHMYEDIALEKITCQTVRLHMAARGM